mgnify:CR=1 FL=1
MVELSRNAFQFILFWYPPLPAWLEPHCSLSIHSFLIRVDEVEWTGESVKQSFNSFFSDTHHIWADRKSDDNYFQFILFWYCSSGGSVSMPSSISFNSFFSDTCSCPKPYSVGKYLSIHSFLIQFTILIRMSFRNRGFQFILFWYCLRLSPAPEDRTDLSIHSFLIHMAQLIKNILSDRAFNSFFSDTCCQRDTVSGGHLSIHSFLILINAWQMDTKSH